MENMTSVELKAMAKELGVKSWWTLKKAELIAEIQKIQGAVESTPVEVDDKNIDEAVENAQVESENDNEESNVDESSNKSKSVQEAPKTSNKKVDLIEYNGKTQSLSAWARELNMPGQTLYARLHISNWSVEKAFTTPSRRKKIEEEA